MTLVAAMTVGSLGVHLDAAPLPGQADRQGPERPPAASVEIDPSDRGVLPSGQELDVRLQTTLSSETSKAEQRFEATTVSDLLQDGRVLVPAGTVVRGVVSSVSPAGRLDRTGTLTLSFDRMTIRGRNVPLRALATEVYKSGGIRDEVGTAGAGAGVGGVIGGLLGGVKGAVLGAVIGAGGAIAATDGKDIELPSGSIVRIRLDSPATVR
jgi:hypothetical protein